MLKKIFKNFVIVAILFAIVFVFIGFSENFDESILIAKEYWWVLIAAPLALRFYGWVQHLKKKAYNVGANLGKK